MSGGCQGGAAASARALPLLLLLLAGAPCSWGASSAAQPEGWTPQNVPQPLTVFEYEVPGVSCEDVNTAAAANARSAATTASDNPANTPSGMVRLVDRQKALVNATFHESIGKAMRDMPPGKEDTWLLAGHICPNDGGLVTVFTVAAYTGDFEVPADFQDEMVQVMRDATSAIDANTTIHDVARPYDYYHDDFCEELFFYSWSIKLTRKGRPGFICSVLYCRDQFEVTADVGAVNGIATARVQSCEFRSRLSGFLSGSSNVLDALFGFGALVVVGLAWLLFKNVCMAASAAISHARKPLVDSPTNSNGSPSFERSGSVHGRGSLTFAMSPRAGRRVSTQPVDDIA